MMETTSTPSANMIIGTARAHLQGKSDPIHSYWNPHLLNVSYSTATVVHTLRGYTKMKLFTNNRSRLFNCPSRTRGKSLYSASGW